MTYRGPSNDSYGRVMTYRGPSNGLRGSVMNPVTIQRASNDLQRAE
jgi:hypothetical protein